MPKTTSDDSKAYWTIFCPACKMEHMIKIPPWTFNGNVEKPTFGGSILARYVKILPEGEAMIERGEYPPKGQSFPHTDEVCHSLVSDGKIQFLGDCTHAMKGQTVDLPDL